MSNCWILCIMCSSEPCQLCTTVNWENSDTTAVHQEFKMYPFVNYSLMEQLVFLSCINSNIVSSILNGKAAISRSFRHYRQEDAHELMVNLLESMHKCCLPSGVPSESPSAYEKSLVHRIFGGRLRSQVKCAQCLHCSNKFDPFLDLSLEIGNAATLVKALHNFTKEELLDGGEKHYNCQHCKQKVVAKKRFTIDKGPSVLTIHLKRFSPFNPLQKIDKKVDFETTLDLKPFVSDSEAMDLKYSLYGVLVHAGWNTQQGHYYCFVRTSSGIWHNLDDNQVRQVREGDVLRQKAYMLFYVRDRIRSSIKHKDTASSLSNSKMIPEKIQCMDDTISNGLVESAMKAFSFACGDTKFQNQIIDVDQPSNISNTSENKCSNTHKITELTDTSTFQNNIPASVQETPSEDHCSNAQNKTEVTDASKSDNNEPASAQMAPFTHLNVAATVSTLTKQMELDSQRETMPPGQHDICVVRAASCDQKACKESLQELQLKSDGSHTDSGKDIADASNPICSGADGLFGANDQATEPQPDSSCKRIPINDTETIDKIIQTEDAAVSNKQISSNEESTSASVAKETEPIHEFDEQFVVVSAKTINDKENEGVQTTVQDGTVQEGQPLVKELSLMDCHMADAEEKNFVQKNSLDNGLISSKKICSEDPSQMVCSEDYALVISSKDSVPVLNKEVCVGNLHRDMGIKSKKHLKYPVVSLFFGSKQLLFGSLKPRKKRKHKRIKRRLKPVIDTESIANDQQTSTSETVHARGKSCKFHKQKHSRNSASFEGGVQFCNEKQNLGDHTIAVGLTLDKQDRKDAALSSAELEMPGPSSIANDSGKCALTNERGSSHFDLLTRGLRQTTVPRWDDIDLSDITARELQNSRSTSIGYVLDERDEEYDRGRRKKVKRPIKDFTGPNPFQETENVRSRQRMRLKADQTRFGNQPRRI